MGKYIFPEKDLKHTFLEKICFSKFKNIEIMLIKMFQKCWHNISQANDSNVDKYLQQQCKNVSWK